MPLSSLQTSGMIGGQVAMFGNQSQMSQQIGSLYGTGPGPTGGAMQAPPSYGGDPFNQTQDTGSKIAGAAGMMAPMAAAGVPLAAGMMGGAAGWADPFTGAMRGFAKGVGGSGLSGTMGQIGAGFGRGALPGLARLGAGVGMAGLAAAPAAAAGMAAVEAGQQFYQGVQTTQDMERVSGQMAGPQYGAGSRKGGKLDRGQIRQMVSVIEELADDNVMASVQTVTKLADKFSQMGMLTGSIDASSFKQKFSNMVKQTDIIAKMMGTSMEEAAPMLQKFQQMGMWTAGDIMGGSAAMKMVGPQSAQQLGGAMGAGAQMVHGMGGRLGAGALAGQKAFMNVQGATNIGALSNQDITEFTGGVGGREGQRMVAQGMMGMTARMAQSPIGKLAVAGMGEFEEGEFTGKMDPEMMRKLKSGELDIGALEKRGRKLTGTREGAASYMMQQKKMQGELVGKGGLEGSAAMMQMVLDKSGHSESSDDIQATVLKHITGATERDVEMAMKLMKELPRIKEDNRKRMKDMLSQRETELDIRMNRSLSGAKDAIKQRWESAWRPVREAGADAAQGIGETVDEAWQSLIGASTTSRMDISSEERKRILSKGGPSEAAQDLMRGGGAEQRLDIKTGSIEKFRRGGFSALFGGDTEGTDTRGEALRHLGQETNLGRPAKQGEYDLGAGVTAKVGATNEARQRVMRLANSNYSLAGLGYSSNPENKKNMETIRDAMVRVAQTGKGRQLADRRRKGEIGEGEYRMQMKNLVMNEGGSAVRDAMSDLRKSRSGGPGAEETDQMELMTIAATGEDGKFDILQFKSATEGLATKELGGMVMTTEGIEKLQDSLATEGASLIMKAAEATKGLSKAARGSSALSTEYYEVTGLDEKEIKKALQGGKKWSSGLRKWLAQGAPDARGMKDAKGNKFLEAALSGNDPEAKKLLDTIQMTRGSSATQALMGKAGIGGTMEAATEALVFTEHAADVADIAREESLFSGRATAALNPEQSKKYKEILELYKSADVEKQTQAAEMSQELAGEVSSSQAQALASAGGTGRMIAGMSKAAELLKSSKGTMSAGTFEARKKKINQAFNYNVFGSMSEEDQAEVKEMAKDGLTKDELTKIQEKVGATAKGAGPQKTMRELIERQEIVADKFGEVAGRLTKWVSQFDGKDQTGEDKNSSLPTDRQQSLPPPP